MNLKIDVVSTSEATHITISVSDFASVDVEKVTSAAYAFCSQNLSGSHAASKQKSGSSADNTEEYVGSLLDKMLKSAS